MRRAIRNRSTVLLLCALVVGTIASATAAAPAGEPARVSFPSVRLFVSEREIEQVRAPEGFLVLEQVPSFIAAVGGRFEVHLRRSPDGRITAQQVTRDGNGEVADRRRLDGRIVTDMTQGFDRFFRATVKNEAGETVHRSTIPFCPLTAERGRLDDTGPQLPSFAPYCLASELTVGMAWGVDAGWAGRAPDSLLIDADLPDGRYLVRLAITPRFRKLFAIPRTDARARFTVELTTGEIVDGVVDSERSPVPEIGDIHGPAGRTDAVAEVAPDASGLPDLIALPPFNVTIAGPDSGAPDGTDAVIFGADVWNGGDGPLVVEGFRRQGQPVMDAYQYFYEDGAVVRRARVGELEFDPQPGHRHWHFRDFARYRIIDDAGNEVATSGKEAFCLAPTDPVDLTLPNASSWPHASGLTTSCGFQGAIWIREILDVGWGDTYYQSVPGQWIDISGVPNGDYLLEVATNQDGRLSELRSDNNVATTPITLGGEPGARTVEEVPPG